jgi:solute:Na+ symporter, SSS family
LQNALQAFQYLLMIGAGTGLIYILRWFWWRVNAWSELSAMAAAAFFSLVFILIENFSLVTVDTGVVKVFGILLSVTYWNIIKFTAVVALTTLSWLTVTLLTKPVNEA